MEFPLISETNRLLYTYTNGVLEGTTPDGCELFCYEDEHMQMLVSFAVNDVGCIITCNRSSLLHIISEDGTQRKTLLNKFDKTKAQNDICFDKSKNVLFVCGDQFVEEYEILY